MNDNIISDATFDKWSESLVLLQRDWPELVGDGYYPELFKDWTGDTGMHLPVTARVWSLARHLLAYGQRLNVRRN